MRKKYDEEPGNAPKGPRPLSGETHIVTDCLIRRETERAWLVKEERWDEEFWLPKRCVILHAQKKRKDLFDIEMEVWLAKEKGLMD
jgi:hypothetical protein